MPRAVQQLGMNHIRNLKQSAIDMWKEYDMCETMWLNCVESVLTRHRLDMIEQFRRGNKEEQEKDRRFEYEIRLEKEAEEQLQRMRDAEYLFNCDIDE